MAKAIRAATVIVAGAAGAAFAAPFPADTPPATVAVLSESSGIVWHPVRQKLYVVDDGGVLYELNEDGSGPVSWNGLDDIEGVTYADPFNDFVYIARERPGSAILEFDVTSGQVTRAFDLSPWIFPSDPNQGIEGLTFVPDPASAEGGYFYAGIQEDGRIAVFELPIQSSATSTVATFVESFTPDPSRVDVAGLDYDRDNEVLYVLWDSDDRFAAYGANRVLLEDWEMYTDAAPNQEGIAVDIVGQRLFSTEDDGGEIYRFTGFAVDTSCSSDPDCDDGLFCNGAEGCDTQGECIPGLPPVCPGQHCSEALGQCVDCLADADCSVGDVCSVSAGLCVDEPMAAPLPVLVGALWRYFPGMVEPPSDWTTVGFDDSGWSWGASGFGYGPDCIAERGTALSDMQDGWATLYLRRLFRIDEAAAVGSLTLTLDYDDGFVAYLNGVEVARNNVSGSPPAHTQLANANHECGTAENFELTLAALRSGSNVLALEGHNVSLGSSDFSILPELDGDVACSPTEVTVVAVERAPDPRLSWVDLGPGVVYDVVGGRLSALRSQGNVNDAMCLADDLPSPTWTDPRPVPPAGDADYYLIRAQQGCGTGSYGSDSSASERQPATGCP